MKMGKRVCGAFLIGLGLVALGLGYSACDGQDQEGTAGLYGVDSFGGGVYEVDLDQAAFAGTALVSSAQNASGELCFLDGLGYLAVGSYSNTAPGLYYFDPDKPEAGAQRIGQGISAQYIAFSKAGLGLVSSADYAGSYSDALYSFDPGDPDAGLSQLCQLSYPQEIAVDSEGTIYVAQNGSASVARLSADGKAIEKDIAASKVGTTGLLSGAYRGENGVFVANLGDWSDGIGSVDFIAGDELTQIVSGPSADCLAMLGSSSLIVSGGYPAKTYRIDLSADSPRAEEILCGDASFGGGDSLSLDGKVYIASGGQTIYAIDSDLSVTIIDSGDDTLGIGNLGAND